MCVHGADRDLQIVGFAKKTNDFVMLLQTLTFSIFEALKPPPLLLWTFLGTLGTPFGLPLVYPGVLLGSLGAMLGSSWAPWNLSWDQLDLLCPPLGTPGRSLESSRIHLEHFELPWLHFFHK